MLHLATKVSDRASEAKVGGGEGGGGGGGAGGVVRVSKILGSAPENHSYLKLHFFSPSGRKR